MQPMILRDEVLATPAYAFHDVPDGIKLDQNEAPDDLSDALRARVVQAMANEAWNRYPELRARRASEAIGERDGWPAAGVLLAPGSNVLIQAIVMAAGIGRKVVTVAPTFSVYGQQARLLGARLTEVPLQGRDFHLDVAALRAALAEGPGVLFLADPAAPTGQRHDDDAIVEVLDTAEANGWLTVVDEAYWPYDGRHRLDLVEGHPSRISLRTFSKADALGGVRLGYALGAPTTITELAKVLLPFNVSVLQSTVAAIVARDRDATAARAARIEAAVAERTRVAEVLGRELGLRVLPSVTNFLAFEVADPAETYTGLLDRGVRIRRQDHLPGMRGFLRVSIGHRHENDAFLDALREIAVPEVA